MAPLSVISFGPWGGKGGGPWSYRPSNGIAEIFLRVEGIIKSIGFQDDKGFFSGTFGDRGGNSIINWEKEEKIKIGWPNEYLKSISGTYGSSGCFRNDTVITSVSFTTNLRTYGPFGTSNGTAFTHPVIDDDNAVVGFHGRCGWYLDSLGTIVAPRHPVEPAVSIGPFGGEGGNPWSYVTDKGIKKIVINSGEVIKSVSFQDATGSNSAKFGGENCNEIGREDTVCIDWPSEYFVSISGSYGRYANSVTMKSLTFATNKNMYGPFGTGPGCDDDKDIFLPVENGKIVGFLGRAGEYLDAIGIIVKPVEATIIQPAKPPVSIAAVGGGGGNPWSYVTNKGIRKIILNFGENVKSLTFQDSTGATSVKFGGQNHNDIGKQDTVCIDTPDEFMTSIKGTYGNFAHLTTITSISFVTNKRTYGPYGMRGHSDKEYSLSSPNTKIVGFHGKAGHYIDSIGIFVSPI